MKLEESPQRVAINAIQQLGEGLFHGKDKVVNDALLAKMAAALNLTEGNVAGISKLNITTERLSELAAKNLDDVSDLLDNSLNYYGCDYSEEYRSILGELGGEGILICSNVDGKKVPIGYALMHRIDISEDVLSKDNNEYTRDTFESINWDKTLGSLNERIGCSLTTDNVLHFWDYAVLKEHRSQGLGKVAMFLASGAVIPPDGARIGFISTRKPDSMIASMKGGSILCNYRESPYPEVDDGHVYTSLFGPSFNLEFTGNVVATNQEAKADTDKFVKDMAELLSGDKFAAYNPELDRYEEVIVRTIGNEGRTLTN